MPDRNLIEPPHDRLASFVAESKLRISRTLDRMARFVHGRAIAARFPHARELYLTARDFLFRPSKIRVLDQWLIIHPYDRSGVSYPLISRGQYEPFETRLFLACLEDGTVVLDVGANIGYYTLIAARQVGTRGHVYALEPEPETFALLQRNVRLNGHSNVTLLQCAASDRDGQLDLYVASANKGDHRTYRPEATDETRTKRPVRSVAIDGLFRDGRALPTVTKMDIQGFEPVALRGMTRMITALSRAVILTEFWPFGMAAAAGDTPGQYYQQLRELGFAIFRIDENSATVAVVGDIAALLGSIDDGGFANLVCVKGSWPTLLAYGISC